MHAILLQRGTPTQVFSCEYCEVFKNTYFEEHLQTADSTDFKVYFVLIFILLFYLNKWLPTAIIVLELSSTKFFFNKRMLKFASFASDTTSLVGHKNNI